MSETVQTPKSNEPKKKQTKAALTSGERLLIEEQAGKKISRLLEQATAHFGGDVRISRSDVVAVILAAHEESLSPVELQALWNRCFDPVKFAGLVAKRVRDASARGESISLEQVMERFGGMAPARDNGSGSRRKRGSRGSGAIKEDASSESVEGFEKVSPDSSEKAS